MTQSATDRPAARRTVRRTTRGRGAALALVLLAVLTADPSARRADDPERGDVPGWVLVTLMTAGLVLLIWALAGPALSNVFTTAIARVTSFGG